MFRVGALRAKQVLTTKWFQDELHTEIFVSMSMQYPSVLTCTSRTAVLLRLYDTLVLGLPGSTCLL